MKLCSILINGNPCVGAKTEGGIVNLTELGFPTSMNEFIAGGDAILTRAEEALRAENLPVLSERDVKFLPVTEPKKIICEGLNFKKHAEETGGTAPDYSIFFSKFSDALAAHNQAVTLPSWLNNYDYEAELVIVIGKSAVNVTIEQAKDCIFGYTCGNDLSARDAQFLSTQWLSGKSLPGFGPTGPYIVTCDSFDPYASNGIYCEVNGVRVQSGDTSDMIFPCYETVSAASRFFPLSPGDLIFTGTPAGVIQGKPMEERVWLKPGDTVNVTIDGIGTLTTPLV